MTLSPIAHLNLQPAVKLDMEKFTAWAERSIETDFLRRVYRSELI